MATTPKDSDLDLLVEPTFETTLFDIGAIQYELKKLLGISVEVLTPGALPDKFRAQVMTEAYRYEQGCSFTSVKRVYEQIAATAPTILHVSIS